MALATDKLSSPNAGLASNRASLIFFALTLFVSAFLLFSVQPFFAKMVLPLLGGSPAVWSVAMVFFQAMLLAGYLYAHFVSRYLTPRIAAFIHLFVMAAALLFMPIAVPAGWETPPDQGQPFWLLGLFAVSVGLPFFAVSANGPLLQDWFAKSGHPHSDDPYFLYGASNLGSFASLFLFAALIEPRLAVPEISQGWMGGFIVLVALIIVCAVFSGSGYFPSKNSDMVRAQSILTMPVSKLQVAKWIGLSFIPSGLLVAVTAHISTDVAATPFVWIIPLAIFLLTFVFAFARRRIFSVSVLSASTTILAVGALASATVGYMMPVLPNLLLNLVFFFSAALLCHTVLVDQRPAPDRLTTFYLWMSFGGVLGGIFTSILAPFIFTRIVEYPILVILSLFCIPDTWQGNKKLLILASCAAAILATIISNPAFADAYVRDHKIIFIMAFCVFAIFSHLYLLRDQSWLIVQIILISGLLFGSTGAKEIISIERSFFGVISAYESPDKKYILMSHGSTVHGAMEKTDDGKKPEPLTYYHRSGGIAKSLFAAQQKWGLAPLGRNANVGVIGLGTGSILCHRKPNEDWVSFEIDAAVTAMASDPSIFRFVPECGQNDPIIIGDARLKIAEQPDGKFDYLLIDAFSSNSIPVHLMTDEAFQLYFSKMAHDGVLAIHISNRYLELASIIQAIAAKNGYSGRIGAFDVDEKQRQMHIDSSLVVVLAKTEAALGSMTQNQQWSKLPDLGTKPWTDNSSDLLGALVRKARDG